MKTNLHTDKKDKIVNEEEQYLPVNPQDNYGDDNTSATAADKKKGYSQGQRNDSNTTEPTNEKTNKIKGKT